MSNLGGFSKRIITLLHFVHSFLRQQYGCCRELHEICSNYLSLCISELLHIIESGWCPVYSRGRSSLLRRTGDGIKPPLVKSVCVPKMTRLVMSKTAMSFLLVDRCRNCSGRFFSSSSWPKKVAVEISIPSVTVPEIDNRSISGLSLCPLVGGYCVACRHLVRPVYGRS